MQISLRYLKPSLEIYWFTLLRWQGKVSRIYIIFALHGSQLRATRVTCHSQHDLSNSMNSAINWDYIFIFTYCDILRYIAFQQGEHRDSYSISRLSDSSRSRSFLDFQNDDVAEPGAPVRGNGSWLPTLRPTLTKWNIIIKARRRGRKRQWDCSLYRGLP